MQSNEEIVKFTIETYDYSNYSNQAFDYGDYHCVYILENGKDAYIGETNDPIRRGKEHDRASPGNKNKQYHFNKIHIITGLLAEETPAKHYENLLIKLMKVVICDESQRLRRGKNLGKYYMHFKGGNERLGFDNTGDELDWILANSHCQILFYDDKQSTSPSDITRKRFEQRLEDDKKRGIRPVKLNEQMRIKAGSSYVPYIYDVLHQRANGLKLFEHSRISSWTSSTIR